MGKRMNRITQLCCSFFVAASLVSCSGGRKEWDVVFEDATYTYDGTAKSLEVKNVPEGIEYSFDISDNDGNKVKANEVINVGIYNFTANFTGEESKYIVPEPKQAKLTIEKAIYDTSLMTFDSLEFTYDGKNHKPTLINVPKGLEFNIVVYSMDEEETEPLVSVTDVGTYRVVASFTADKNHKDVEPIETKMVINKAKYDMSKLKIEGLVHEYDGERHLPTVSGVPGGVTYKFTIYKQGETTPITDAVDVGFYKVVVSFAGSDKYEPIADREVTLNIRKTLTNVKARSRTFNVNDTTDRKVAVIGDLEGSTPVYKYTNSAGAIITDINNAPVGEYDVEISFTHPDYPISTVLDSKITVTNKIVKNIASYQDLVDMAKEAQNHFTLLEATGDTTSGYWSTYNGGNPEDRWSSKVTYQLVNDIDCGDNIWKAAGWNIGAYLQTEHVVDEAAGKEWKSILGTSEVDPITGEVINPGYVVNHPRQDGPEFYGFGYVSVYLDGNGYSVKNLKLDNDTHVEEHASTDELGKYPEFVELGIDNYRKTGLFVSSSYSTYKNIVFENPSLDIDDTSSTVVWAGFINASEGYNNTYEGLEFVNPTIDVNSKKANIGTLAGITLVLASDKADSVRGADYYLDRPEENEFYIKDVKVTNADYTSNATGRNSLGGLYGESQSAWWTFNIDNFDIDGTFNITGGSANNGGDIFGFIDTKYMTKGKYEKDPNPFFTFNISNSQSQILYVIPTNEHFGTGVEGDSYHVKSLTADTYEADKYYYLPAQSTTFTLASGAFNANEIYFEKRDGKEILDTNYFYMALPNENYVGIVNDHLNITNSKSLSGYDVTDALSGVSFNDLVVEYDGNPHSNTLTGSLPAGFSVDYENNNQVEIGEYTIIATITFKDGIRTVATVEKEAKLTITPRQVNPKTFLGFENKNVMYDGKYHSYKLDESTIPDWVDVEYTFNTRKEIGSQTIIAKVSNTGNPEYEFTTDTATALFTIDPYIKEIDEDTDKVIAIANEDTISLVVKNLGTSGTADVVYFRSFEYFNINEESGVSTNRTDGTVISGVTYNCGTNQTIVFDRVLPNSFDLVYAKFALRISTGTGYQLLYQPVYCKYIHSQFGYSTDLRTSIKGIDYPPFSPTDSVDHAISVNGNFSAFNLVLKDCIFPNERYDEKTGEITSNIPYIDMSQAIPHTVNGVTYYIKKINFEQRLDYAVARSKETNTRLIGILYNWNEPDQGENPYFVTYPDARDPGSMAQFALNTSNVYGEGYVIAVIDFMMQRYSEEFHHVFKDFIVGNELELAQRWYPIQTYQGKQFYSARKFAAEYSRTIRLVNNTIKKYIPDGKAFAPFSIHMNPDPNLLEPDQTYAMTNLIENINYMTKREGDFDWGVVAHPYGNSDQFDRVYSATSNGRYSPFTSTINLSYVNPESLDKFLRQEDLLYNKEVLRQVIFVESGIYAQTKLQKNKTIVMACVAFTYYRCANLDSIYALCLSDYGVFNMFDEERELYKQLDGPNSFEASEDLFYKLKIFDREKGETVDAKILGYDSWRAFMDVWQDPETNWHEMWDDYKIIVYQE